MGDIAKGDKRYGGYGGYDGSGRGEEVGIRSKLESLEKLYNAKKELRDAGI